MKNKKLLIGILIIVVLITGILSCFLVSKKDYVLHSNNYENINISIKQEKNIKLKVEEDKYNIILEDFNNKNNSNYLIYVLTNSNNKIVSKGVVYSDSDTVIEKVNKDTYNLKFIYLGNKKIDLKGKIKLDKGKDVEYSTLISGRDINDKISEYTNREYKDDKIKSIKLVDSIDKEYEKDKYIVSTSDSSKPIYMWVSDDIINFYSENKIEFGEYTSFMFSNLANLTDANDLKYFNSSKVENMNYMFYNDESLSDIKFISYFDTSSVNDMSNLFGRCYSLIDITPMIGLETNSLKVIDQIIESTSVSDITVFKYFDTSSLESMMSFISHTKVNDIEPIKDWDVSHVDSMLGAFCGTNIEDVDALKKWDTSKVKNMSYIFSCCVKLEDIRGLRDWDTSSLEKISHGFDYTRIKNVDALKNWNTNKLKEIDKLFSNVRELENIDGVSDWNVSKVSSLRGMFEYTSISNIDSLSKWNTKNNTSLESTFSHTKIKNVNGLKKWNTEKVENYKETFDHTKLENVSGIDNWNIENGSDFEKVFYKTKVKPKWKGTWLEDNTFVK